MKRTIKHVEHGEELPLSTLALVERTGLDESKKQELVELLKNARLPRDVVREALKEVSENPGEAAAIVERHILSMPKHVSDNTVEASGKNTYILRREANAVEFTARSQNTTLWTVKIPLQDLHVVKRLWKQA